MACTAEQIARRVGCSIATVSRVLNNSAPVSDQARSAVLDAVREAGGVPRVLGRRAPKVKRTPVYSRGFQSSSDSLPQADLVEILMAVRYTRPMISPDTSGGIDIDHNHRIDAPQFFSANSRYTTSYYRHIVDGAIAELKRINMRAVLQTTDSLTSAQLIDEVNRPTNAGLVVLGDYFDELGQFFHQVTCPVVSLVTWDQPCWPDYVGIDNQMGIRQAFEHVYNLGHRRIGYISGFLSGVGVFRERLAAFELCLAEKGLLPDCQKYVWRGHCDIESMQNATTALLSMSDRPTALLGCYDGAALAIKRSAGRLGLKIPTDLSVVGFDDEEMAQLFSPPLTTVHVPSHQMGRLAIQTLQLRRVMGSGDRTGAFSNRIMPTLVVRESTGPVAKGPSR